MKIAIDARALGWAGIGRFTRNLLNSLASVATNHEFLVAIRAEDSELFAELRREGLPENFSAQVVEGSYYSWREQLLLPRQLSRLPAELFHFTHFNAPLAFQRPYLVTIHDVTRFIFPGQKRQDLRQQVAYEYVFAKTVQRARAVVCVSETTRQALTALPLHLPAQVTSIPEAVDASFLVPPSRELRQKVRMLLGTTAPYLLYVGVWMNHKNLTRLIEAFAQVHQLQPNLKLVLTGKPKPGYSNVLKLVQTHELTEHIIFAGFVPDHLMPALYAEALCCVFPSLYEGFGLPPLEAMAAGTPVVASHVSSLPEVLGDAALYVNPEYVPDLVQKIMILITKTAVRERLITLGHRQAKRTSWLKSAAQYRELYDTIS